MAARIIDGKQFAQDLRIDIADKVAKLKLEHKLVPGLAVVLVGEDPASTIYVKNKDKFTKEAGMNSWQHRLSSDVAQEELLKLVQELNDDPNVHGILVQLPLPKHIDSTLVINSIDPDKDVDGFHAENVGRLSVGLPCLTPCTPLGVILLLKHYIGSLAGKSALVIGRSNIVGKPMLQLLLQEDATVTLAHSKTANIAKLGRESDIIVAAVGRPEMVKADWIKPMATVIDVGINRVDASGNSANKTKLVGDVDFSEVQEVAGLITPVPGGVGPMTIACLLRNTVTAACMQNAIAGFYDS